jgi:hypothetical protein
MLSAAFALFLKQTIFLMKRILFMTVALFGLSQLKAQTNELAIKAVEKPVTDVLLLKTAEYDFGTIPQNKPVYYYFEIVNTGTTPLKLDNVQASCGCTTPEWSKDPIPAGGSEKIKVGFNAASEGPFDRFITVMYNGNQTKQLRIKGTVWKAPAGSAPANQSLTFLKQQIQ